MKKWETYADVDRRMQAKPRRWWERTINLIATIMAIYLLAGISYAWLLQAAGFSTLVAWVVSWASLRCRLVMQ